MSKPSGPKWNSTDTKILLGMIEKMKPRSNQDWDMVARKIGDAHNGEQCRHFFEVLSGPNCNPKNDSWKELHKEAMKCAESLAFGNDSDSSSDSDFMETDNPTPKTKDDDIVSPPVVAPKTTTKPTPKEPAKEEDKEEGAAKKRKRRTKKEIEEARAKKEEEKKKKEESEAKPPKKKPRQSTITDKLASVPAPNPVASKPAPAPPVPDDVDMESEA